MTDSFTETTTEGYFSRIGKSFAGLIFGPLFIIGAVILLGWNEGRAVRTAAGLSEGKNEVVAVSTTIVEPSNNGHLVYLSGPATSDETLQDEDFEVSHKALVLRRDVQQYQWKEQEDSSSHKNVGGSQTTTNTYRYEKVWSGSVINSGSFKHPEDHQNPESFTHQPQTFVAHDAKVGAFRLDESLVKEIGGEEQLPVKGDSDSDEMKPYNGGFYIGADPKTPQIGDEIVKFFIVAPVTVSVAAAQQGDSLTTFVTKNGTNVGLIESGVHTSEELFATAVLHNTLLTWGLRLLGFFLIFCGFAAIMQPLSVLADVLPFLGSIVGFGTGLVAFVLAMLVSVITIAIAWLAFRPVMAILLMIAVVGVSYALISRRKKRGPAAAAPAAA